MEDKGYVVVHLDMHQPYQVIDREDLPIMPDVDVARLNFGLADIAFNVWGN